MLEKAYAKLNTCYEFLDCGLAVDAMIDMTGGVHESFAIRNGSKGKAYDFQSDVKKISLDIKIVRYKTL